MKESVKKIIKWLLIGIAIINPVTMTLYAILYYAITKPAWEELPLEDFLPKNHIAVIESRHDTFLGYRAEFIIRANHADDLSSAIKKMAEKLEFHRSEKIGLKQVNKKPFGSKLKHYSAYESYEMEALQGVYTDPNNKDHDIMIDILRSDQSNYFYISLFYPK